MKDLMKSFDMTVKYLKEKLDAIPEIAIILGSGLGNLANLIENKMEIPYEDIPDFPRTTVAGHEGKLIYGTLSGRNILAMKGRFHFYEGYRMDEVVYPIRVFKCMGIENIIVTNAAGGINTSFSPGDLMLITDHIGLFAKTL